MREFFDMVSERVRRVYLISVYYFWCYVISKWTLQVLEIEIRGPRLEEFFHDKDSCDVCASRFACLMDDLRRRIGMVVTMATEAWMRNGASWLELIFWIQITVLAWKVTCFVWRCTDVGFTAAVEEVMDGWNRNVANFTDGLRGAFVRATVRPVRSVNAVQDTTVSLPPANANPRPSSAFHGVKLDRWNRDWHERIFRTLEFECPDVCVRVRTLTAVFDPKSVFGESMLEIIRSGCLEYLPTQELPENEFGLEDDMRRNLRKMWSELKALFERMCLEDDAESDQIKTLSRVTKMHDETRLAFAYRFRTVLRLRCTNVQEKTGLEMILNQLDRPFHEFLRTQHFREGLTMEAVIMAAKQFEQWDPKLATGLPHSDSQRTSSAGVANQGSVLVTKRNDQNHRKVWQVRCQICDKLGHNAKSCNKRKELNYPSVLAGDGNGMNHEQSDVVMPKGGEGQSLLLHLSTSVWSATEDKQKIRFLIDTGASVNLLPTRLVKKHAWALNDSEKIHVLSYTGQRDESQGTVCLNVILGDVTKELVFHVVSVAKEPILGLDGLSALGAVIDCEAKSIRMPSGRSIMCSEVHEAQRIHQCKVFMSKEAAEQSQRTENEKATQDKLSMVEDEDRGVLPFRKGNLVYCPSGRSLVLSPQEMTLVQLPYHVDTHDIILASSGNTGSNIAVIGSAKQRRRALKYHAINLGKRPEHVGSKNGLACFEVQPDQQVEYRKIDGTVVMIQENRKGDSECVSATCCSMRPADEENDEVRKWQREFPDVLTLKMGKTTHYEVDDSMIKTDVEWGKLKPRAYSAAENRTLAPLVQELLDLDVIEKVRKRPEVSTPMLVVAKKDGKMRLVHDFRLLNSVTSMMQNVAMDRMKILASVRKQEVWTSLDLQKGFMQVPLHEEVRGVFGFEFDGCWMQFKRCPFGWVNSMQHFCTAMRMTLQEARMEMPKGITLESYVDDILLGTSTAVHDDALRILFQWLRQHGWTVNPSKATIKTTEVDFLGHHFDAEGIELSSGLITKLNELIMPRNKQQLRSFFGLCIQLEKFAWKLRDSTAKLEPWLKKAPREFEGSEFREMWNQVIREVSERIVKLGYPSEDEDLEVAVDASGDGIGAVLMSGGRPIAFFSRRTTKQWRHSSDSEIDGVLKALQAFQMFIACRPVKVLTDNWSAYRIANPLNCGAPVLRRIEEILQFNPNVEFVAGKDNTFADFLSRDLYMLQHGSEGKSGGCGRANAVDQDVESDKLLEIHEEAKKMHEEGHAGYRAIRAMLHRKGLECKGMAKVIRDVVDSCDVCKRWRKREFREDFSFNEATEISAVVGLDFVGPLKAIRGRKSRHLAVAVDGLSRLMMAIPVKSCSTAEAQKAVKEWQKEHGKIKCLVTDAGSSFSCRDFKDFCDKQGVNHKMAAPGHQSSNGLVERAIQSLMNRVKKVCFGKQRTWDRVWRNAVKNYNETPHGITTFSPDELRYGDSCGAWMDEEELLKARKIAVAKTRAHREVWQRGRQKNVKSQHLEVGDRVLRYDPGGGKLEPQWSGPFNILEIPHPRLYRISQAPVGSRAKGVVIHGDDLMKVTNAQGSVSD